MVMNKIPKGYKQTEVGIIPEDWEVKKLNKLSDVRDGTHDSPKYVKNGIIFITSKNIIDGKLDFSDVTYITKEDEEQINKRSKVDKGDILMSMIGTIGNCVLIDFIPNFCIKNVALIKPNNVDNLFLCQLLNSNYYQTYINDRLDGGIQKFISLGTLRELDIPFPKNQKEQSAIAEALSDVDALISSLDELIAKKRNIKQGAMQELLTGKRRLPGFSGEWEEKRMSDCFNFSGGYSASREQLSQEGYCYLHYGDIHGSSKTFIDVNEEYSEIPKLNIDLKKISKKSFLCEGDVVFVDASEDDEGASRHIVIFNSNAIPYISGLHTIVSKSKNNLIDNNYKRYCFQPEYVKSQFKFYAAGTKVTGISKTNIAKIFINLPPTLEEQSSIAAVLSDMDAAIEQLERKRDKYKQIKQGMMQELLTGKTRLI
jgi:type I restriction enzyme S subunit